jgi:hypothetical protein
VDKAVSALTAAVEIYNKPNWEYREETFALLAVNAWELLLKARVLQRNDNDLRSLYEYGTRATKSGRPSAKKYVQRNPSGTARTISLQRCISKLQNDAQSNLPPEVRANLLALCEIRDSAAHFITASPVLRGQILAVAVAAVKNFVLLAKSWFLRDFAEQLSLVLPLGFLSPGSTIESVVVNTGEGKLIEYLRQLAESSSGSDSPYDVAVKVDVRLKRSNLSSATRVQVVNDATATPVVLTEESILETYPWKYEDLTAQLSKRYSDFSVNSKYHTARKRLASDKRYAWTRLLDPRNPKSGKKLFFSPAILNEFDKEYTKRET